MSEQGLGPTVYRRASTRAGRRGRLLRGALCSAVLVALPSAAWSTVSPAAGASTEAPGQTADLVWVCRAGQAKATDPCASSLAATTVTAAGTRHPATGGLAALGAGLEVRLLLRPSDRQTCQDRQHRLGGYQVGHNHRRRTSRPIVDGL
jgi:hypothetical protein